MEDKFLRLVSDCQVVVSVFGNPTLRRFRFEPVDVASLSLEGLDDIVNRQDFVGLIGLAEMLTPRVEIAVELDEKAVSTLSKQFSELMESTISLVEKSMRGNGAN